MIEERYVAAEGRYEAEGAVYRRAGRSGIRLPALSLGLWQNFGATTPEERQRAILRRAFDLGITHFDLANNYGPPYGAAEEGFGRHLARDLGRYRDELVISSKAGYDMWSGPYGDGGSRKYLFASLDQSLRRMGLDHVDVFYHHRPDPETPIEETMGALADIVRSGRARYAAISNYSPIQTDAAAAAIADAGGSLLLHQPRYSMLDRHVEHGLLDTVGRLGLGMVVFSPLAQGLLTDRYLRGVPEGSRATHSRYLSEGDITEAKVAIARELDGIARERGQSLAQLALAWVLRDERVTSAIVGASSVEQLEANVAALAAPPLEQAELDTIDAALARA
ncbi:aldo/keto reductase [Agrococcus terreus]|uniref:aldo/keto reductase n=1 Tax=Agrococcus terreus TaxID=574649 RepID=UPI00384DB096